MKKGAILVNTARKEVINEKELIKLMEERSDLKYLTDLAPDAKEEFKSKFEGRYFSTPKKMAHKLKKQILMPVKLLLIKLLISLPLEIPSFK